MSMARIELRGAENTLPVPCQSKQSTRRTFVVGSVRLTVPNAAEDKRLRWYADHEQLDFATIYRNAGLSYLKPPSGMWACCLNVLRTKYFDPELRIWRLGGWTQTCAGYLACFENYVKTLGEQENGKEGRMKIAENLYSPTTAEAKCIKREFFHTGNVAQAYAECGASDIIPTFPGAMPALYDALTYHSDIPMYEMLKTLYMIAPSPEPAHDLLPHEPIPHYPHPPPDEPEKSNLLIYAGISLAILALAR